jgi:hypothetical protein
MRDVYFETDNAIFRFYYDDVVERPLYYESTLGTTEVTIPRDFFSQSRRSIKVPREQHRFAYLALDLIEKGKGVVYCKACKRYYEAKKLKRVAVGHGESPFSVSVKGREWLRNLFKKKQRLPLYGGKGYRCPEGHELIAVVTWRT